MTIIPRALVSHQLRCDVQECHACGEDHVGLHFAKLPQPYGAYTRMGLCPNSYEFMGPPVAQSFSFPILITEVQAGPFAAGKDD